MARLAVQPIHEEPGVRGTSSVCQYLIASAPRYLSSVDACHRFEPLKYRVGMERRSGSPGGGAPSHLILPIRVTVLATPTSAGPAQRILPWLAIKDLPCIVMSHTYLMRVPTIHKLKQQWRHLAGRFWGGGALLLPELRD